MRNPRDIVPPEDAITNPKRNTLYYTDDPQARQKIIAVVGKSTELFQESQNHSCNVHDIKDLTDHTLSYFNFCFERGIVPSFRRLANWYGYSVRHLNRIIQSQSPEGEYLDRVKDAIKDIYEQAALVNAVNNISAMFILKSQYDYVEATKVILEPSESLLGQPKSPEEIASYIDSDIVED